MKLVTVDRALKELQNDIVFPTSCLVQAPYLVKFPLSNFKVPLPGTLSICICIYDNIRYSQRKGYHFVALLKLYLLILVSLKLEFPIRGYQS